MNAIEASELFRIYSTPEGDTAALQGLTMGVGVGEVVVVLGPSGSGKSSLLRILAGLDRPSAGSLRVFGAQLAKLSRGHLARYRAETVGYADQHYAQALAPELRARELVALPLLLRGAPRRERERRADELLERVGLLEERGSYPHELSGGEQQRVVLAAALSPKPPLLLADEPTGELDTASAELVYELVGDLVRESGTTTVLVSHDSASTAIADRVLQIRDGRLAGEVASAAGGREAIVVGRGGWLRLPEEWLLRVGARDRAEASLEESRIVIEGAAQAVEPRAEPAAILPALDEGPAHPSSVVASFADLAKRYGLGPTAMEVFSDLSGSFSGGSLYAVTGPSGSGKTTLLHILAGLEQATSGEVTVLGRSLAPLDNTARAALRAAHVGIVGQQSGLIPFLSASENVELGLAIRGAEAEDTRERAREALAAVGLETKGAQRIGNLSSGEQARVALARALASRPQLLLVDEPTSRLDEGNALAVTALLGRLAHALGIAVVCATHDPRVVEQADAELSLADTAARQRTVYGPVGTA